jgi:hypothetical protein
MRTPSAAPPGRCSLLPLLLKTSQRTDPSWRNNLAGLFGTQCGNRISTRRASQSAPVPLRPASDRMCSELVFRKRILPARRMSATPMLRAPRHGVVAEAGVGVEAAADWDDLKSPETYACRGMRSAAGADSVNSFKARHDHDVHYLCCSNFTGIVARAGFLFNTVMTIASRT